MTRLAQADRKDRYMQITSQNKSCMHKAVFDNSSKAKGQITKLG